MVTSGTHTFNLDTAEIIQEAYERCGIETKSGYDLKTARRSLNLLLTKWVNDGVNLFTLNLETIAMTKDQDHITVSAGSHLDILDGVIRDNSDTSSPQDVSLERISLDEYLQIPTKSDTGKPVQFSVERNAQFTSSGTATHKIYLWPIPEIPKRYLPALISGLAVELAMKKAPDRLQVLKPFYDEDWAKAKDEDRERVSFYVQPQVY
jgi:hypothetical protein